MTESQIRLRLAEAGDGPAWWSVIHEAFSARRPVDPPAEALGDTPDDIEQAIRDGYGVGVELDGELAGCLILAVDGPVATLRRVSVLPRFSRVGVAAHLVRGALDVAADLGCTRAQLMARAEFPELVAWWGRHGFQVVADDPPNLLLARDVPRLVEVPTTDDMRGLGRQLARVLRAGDVVILSGELGAGKTTLTQGIGEGLRVTSPVISPTFVISRVHHGPGPDLVHVDAYRMGGGAELADIDLDESLDRSVTVIEWGAGLAEWLAADRLEIRIDREADTDSRVVVLDGVGQRWQGVLQALEVA